MNAETYWRIAEFAVQLGVAFGTGGLAYMAWKEMKLNRQVRELEIFEKYSENYDKLKNNHIGIITDFLDVLYGKLDPWFGSDAKDNFEKNLYLFEREWFLFNQGWVSSEVWKIWNKGINSFIYQIIKNNTKGYDISTLFHKHNFLHQKPLPLVDYLESGNKVTVTTQIEKTKKIKFNDQFLQFMQEKLNKEAFPNA